MSQMVASTHGHPIARLASAWARAALTLCGCSSTQDDAKLEFPLLTPMLVMPLATFKAQRRIQKSTTIWREFALRIGDLVEFDEQRHVAIFVSHCWWDREFTDNSNDPDDEHDKGAPDYQDAIKHRRNKDLKWRVLCAGVDRLVAYKGWDPMQVVLWIDWQSLDQQDKALKLKGVTSLINYVKMCKAMLVPTEETSLRVSYPNEIPQYGTRGWCRIEYFIFALLSEMADRNGKAEMYAAARDGKLKRFSDISFDGGAASDMPDQGAFSVESDREIVRGLQNDIIKAFGHAMICQACKDVTQTRLHLNGKMLQDQHMSTLCSSMALMAQLKVRSWFATLG